MKRNYETCAARAAEFTVKARFREACDGEYQWLKRNRLMDQACAHMVSPYRTITDGDIWKIASGYKSRKPFKLGDQSAYNAATRRGILDDVCAHMTERYRILTDEQISEIASRFSTRAAFLGGDRAAYQTAKKRGILDAMCQNMDGRNGNRRLSDAEVLTISKQYQSRNDFKLGDFGAYTTAIRRGLIVEACAHMEYGAWGFREDRPAALYQFRMEMACGQVLYKIGITNRKPHQRLATMGMESGVTAHLSECLAFASGRDARIAEKRLHRRLKDHRYSGPPILKNGNTELFTIGMLDT